MPNDVTNAPKANAHQVKAPPLPTKASQIGKPPEDDLDISPSGEIRGVTDDPIFKKIETLKKLEGYTDEDIEGEGAEEGEQPEIPTKSPKEDEEAIDDIPEDEAEGSAEGAPAEIQKPAGPEAKSVQLLKSLEGFPDDVAEYIKKAPPEIRGKLAKFVRDKADARASFESYNKFKEKVNEDYGKEIDGLVAAFKKNGNKIEKADIDKFQENMLKSLQSNADEAYMGIWQMKLKLYGGAAVDYVEQVTDEKYGTWRKDNQVVDFLLAAIVRDIPPKDHKAFFEALRPLLQKKAAPKRGGKPVRASKNVAEPTNDDDDVAAWENAHKQLRRGTRV